MRELNHMELSDVAGGAWSFKVDLKIFEFTISGPESIQDITHSVANGMSSAYWAARDATADFYESVANWYHLGCTNGGGGR